MVRYLFALAALAMSGPSAIGGPSPFLKLHLQTGDVLQIQTVGPIFDDLFANQNAAQTVGIVAEVTTSTGFERLVLNFYKVDGFTRFGTRYSYDVFIAGTSVLGDAYKVALSVEKDQVRDVQVFMGSIAVPITKQEFTANDGPGHDFRFMGREIIGPSIPIAQTDVAAFQSVEWDARYDRFSNHVPTEYGMNQNIYEAIEAARREYIEGITEHYLSSRYATVHWNSVIRVMIEPQFKPGRTIHRKEAADQFRIFFETSHDVSHKMKAGTFPPPWALTLDLQGKRVGDCSTPLTQTP